MSKCYIRIIFDFMGIDEDSSKKLVKIISEKREYGFGKISSVGKGCNTIKLGEEIPNCIAEITFYLVSNRDNYDVLLNEILKDISELGHDFSYAVENLHLIFDDGISKSLLEKIMSKERENFQIRLGIPIYNLDLDVNSSRKIVFCDFSLDCDDIDYLRIINDIKNDFNSLDCGFEIKYGLED